jgi:hypothetical protein
MPSGMYPRKPKPPNPFKLAVGRTIASIEGKMYHESITVHLDNGDDLIFEGYDESEMFNQHWSAVAVRYKVKEKT